MAEEKEKAVEKDQEIKTPAGARKDELSDEEIKRVAGGTTTLAPVPPPKNMMPR